MRFFIALFVVGIFFSFSLPAEAVGMLEGKKQKSQAEARDLLASHKALYDISLVATRSGSQIINISGQMFYEWKPTCDAWITDHRFNLFYEYADSPGMKITSDFSTFETFDGESFNFSARRKRDDSIYQEFRGRAIVENEGGEAVYNIPDDLNFDLDKNAMFPMTHTVEMIRTAKENKKFFQAVVFDGSDDEGPVSINTFIGKPANAMQVLEPSENIDMTLLNTPAWNVRMAVFPVLNEEASSDYEMSMIFHENGVISDMLIDYDDFSVAQKLVALEKVEAEGCDNPATPSKPEKTDNHKKNQQN